MRRFVIIILAILCWFIAPSHAETYRVNGGSTYGVAQNPTMNMRSTSPYATNSYSMYYSANGGMQESGIQSYCPTNMNSNAVYCPGVAVLGVKADQISTNNNSTTGGPKKGPGGGSFNDKDHWWVYESSTNTWRCAKCKTRISAGEYEDEEFGWCTVPLELDWKVMAFMAVFAAGYMAYKKRTSHRTKTSTMRTTCE